MCWFGSFLAITVKESGLGQAAFSVVPLAVGYLPYPRVSVSSLACAVEAGGAEENARGGVSMPSAAPVPMSVYVRTSGKQVHVLGPLSYAVGGAPAKLNFKKTS